MKILGIGVDIIENKRIKEAIKNKSFINRVYSVREQRQSNLIKNKVAFFSKRFAAKEAFSKALGMGFRNGLNFNDISVINDKFGKPTIKINGKLKSIINNRFKTKKVNIYLSLADEKKHSIAFVILGK